MPLERRLQRLKVLEEVQEEDDDPEAAKKLQPLFDEEKEESITNETLTENIPSSKQIADPESTLESFRHEWKAELDSKNKATKPKDCKLDQVPPNSTPPSEEFKLQKASSLFLEGVDFERRGEMCDAVQRYMAAVRLVPDIELKLFKNRHSANSSNARSPDSRGHRRSRSRSAAVAGFEEDNDLEGTFQRRIAQRGSIIEADNCGTICPFSLLPAELLMTIVKYVVGGELDVRCLEMLSMTSTGFYLLSRDEELWRTICRRVFGEHRLTPQDNSVYACWRQMYVCRPHVYLHGVYIGKCTYIRHGEASFQDKFYRPWHIVVYYRFMKFFADGTAIMVTSPENPAQVVPQLKSKSTRLGGVLFGRYWPIGQDRIALQFCRRCEKSDQRPRRYQRLRQHFIPHEVSLQEFNMELRFGDGKKRSAHCVLQWEKYDCCFQYLSGQISHSSLDTGDHQLFPPLFFSRVKSFAQPDGWDEMLA